MGDDGRVLLVGDDTLALGGLDRLLSESAASWRVVGRLRLGQDVRSSSVEEPDVAIVDWGESTAAEATGDLLDAVPVLALVSGEAQAREAMAAGARGALLRDTDRRRLSRALEAVMDGLVVLDEELVELVIRPPVAALASLEELTPRELEVLEELALGLTNKDIAQKLGVSPHTIKFHVNSLMSKLGATSRTEVVTLAARAGLLAF